MTATPFRWRHRVTYAECTVGNHVYYARYLDILETARGEFFRALGAPLASLQEADMIFPVVECRLAYRAPARYDDELDVEVWVAALSRVRVTFGYRVWRGAGELLVEGSTNHVCTGRDEKPKRMTPELCALLRPHLAAGAAAA